MKIAFSQLSVTLTQQCTASETATGSSFSRTTFPLIRSLVYSFSSITQNILCADLNNYTLFRKKLQKKISDAITMHYISAALHKLHPFYICYQCTWPHSLTTMHNNILELQHLQYFLKPFLESNFLGAPRATK